METETAQTMVEIDFDLSDDDMTIDLNATVVPERITERSDKKRDETKPAPTSRYKELLLKENEWLKAETNRLGARRYGHRCAIEKLTQRITRLLCRREHVLKELRKLEQ